MAEQSLSVPGKLALSHKAGDTLTRIITITEGGAPVNFTGATIEMIVSEREDGVNPKATWTLAQGIANNSNIAAGEIIIKAQTQGILLPKKTYYYKLRVTFPDGVIKTYLEDKLTTS